jgi:hypothetical protein
MYQIGRREMIKEISNDSSRINYEWINKQTSQKLIAAQLNVKWTLIIRELIINQMKDIMFYLHREIDNVDLEQGISSSNVEQTQKWRYMVLFTFQHNK